MSGYRPALRPHLRVEDGRLVDGLLGRSFPLADAMAALVPQLDGERGWLALREALVAEGHDGDELDDALRRLCALHLVVGAGDELHAALERALDHRAEAPVETLAGARFGCQGSGACCRAYALGPLTDDDVARLDGLDLAAAFPDLSPPYVEREEGRGYLRRTADGCVFLGADHLCRLHVRFGAEMKPGLCRQYPYESFATVTGVRVADRGSCSTFGVSARSGLPLVDDLPRLRSVMAPPVLWHPIATVDGRAWDHGLYLRFTAAAIALSERANATAADDLVAIARLLDVVASAVAGCPLEPGQPDRAVGEALAAALGPDVEELYAPVDGYAATVGLRRVTSLLGELAPALLAGSERAGSPTATARFRELAELVEHALDRLADCFDVPAPGVLAADVDDALRISLRQQLFGRTSLVAGQAGAALVRLGLVHVLALADARRQVGARPLSAADVGRGHSLALRALETGALDHLLVAHDSRWRELVDGLAVAARAVAAG